MKILFTFALMVQHAWVVIAFTAPTIAKTTFHQASSTTSSSSSSVLSPLYNQQKGGSSAELGLPCVDECALESFPNLPPSVHPGVLSGQAQIDLLNHAKENGTYRECVRFVLLSLVSIRVNQIMGKKKKSD
jgi:hypothetical protein